MKAVGKLKQLMWDNVLNITQEGAIMEMIVTNKASGNHILINARSWTELTNSALRDVKYQSKDGSFNF
jgi:hypothetical protein